jgi:hypothetical protein
LVFDIFIKVFMDHDTAKDIYDSDGKAHGDKLAPILTAFGILQLLIVEILKIDKHPGNVKNEGDYNETYDLKGYIGLLPEFYLVSAIGAKEDTKLYPIDSEWPGSHTA